MISGYIAFITRAVTKLLSLFTVSAGHKIEWESSIDEFHLVYTPPNAADYGYNIYNEVTGKASFVQQAQAVPQKE